MAKFRLPENPKPWIRFAILMLGIMGLSIIHFCFYKTIIPTDAQTALLFQGGLLFVILGSLLIEDKFTKPVDALVNALAAFLSIVTVHSLNPPYWNFLAIYFLAVFLAASLCICLGLPQDFNTRHPLLSRFFYKFSVVLGKSNLIFSIVFLYSLFVFFGIQSQLTITLILFWGIYLIIWPLKLPHIIQYFLEQKKTKAEPLGVICRVESPSLVRVKIREGFKWEGATCLIACLPNNDFRCVYPLYSQFQEEITIGTGLLLGSPDISLTDSKPGEIYMVKNDDTELNDQLLSQYYRLNGKLGPVGLVVEGSAIGSIKFEVWDSLTCEEGMLVFCKIDNKYVYYQIIEGTTHEEALEKDRHGFQVAHAIQLGVLNSSGYFKKYRWVPSMNIPVFPARSIKKPIKSLAKDIFPIGEIPQSSISVYADLNKLRIYHTAILGVTGSGKSELAFELIRKNVEKKIKVFCVDLTGIYQGRLQDLNPADLGLSDQIADELGKKIYDTETGAYGAPQEKKILKQFADQIRSDIEKKVEAFLLDKNQYLGIFNLPTISNTKATLYATEIYLSSIFNYSRLNRSCPPILIVLEEAHTVIPESKTMGLGDFESQGMVAKISQIALQGRKYNVGLLIVAQRTANVSKTVLSQCNTVFTFSTFDETGINYMSNIFGRDFSNALPNLDFLQVIGFGKGLLSDRPVIFQIPYDENKDEERQGAILEEIEQSFELPVKPQNEKPTLDSTK